MRPNQVGQVLTCREDHGTAEKAGQDLPYGFFFTTAST